MSTRPLAAATTGTEYHWIMGVHFPGKDHDPGNFNGVITIVAPTTRAQVFGYLKGLVVPQVVERTGRPEFSVTSFTLEPNAIIPGGVQ